MFKKLEQSENLDKYIYEFGVNETPIEKELREYNEKNHPNSSHLQISPDQSEFLKLVIKIGNYKNILELGTYLGYSALSMALATKGKITTIDQDSSTNDIARKFWEKAGVLDKITSITGDALKEIDQLSSIFDFIFIDADKTNYIHYYEKCKKIIADDGVLVFDNVLWRGKVAKDTDDKKTLKIKEFNNHVKNDNYFETSLISIGDGIMLCKKKSTI